MSNDPQGFGEGPAKWSIADRAEHEASWPRQQPYVPSLEVQSGDPLLRIAEATENAAHQLGHIRLALEELVRLTRPK